ncbi:hypothetical protein [Streptomyces sp. NPDC048428]|uniref:hypothetical protein n=1 Tax=Streptomyces sp. NPDC048428 TaxID=3154503 RepID=UPI003425E5A6
MSQHWQQEPQPYQPAPNPYLQAPAQPPAPPQMPPAAPPQGFGGFPQQQPYPGGGYAQQPYPGAPQQPRSGNAVGAFFLGLPISLVMSLVLSGALFAVYKSSPASATTFRVVYGLAALLIAAAVGAVVGRVGGRSGGAHAAAGFLTALGIFFGFTNYLFPVLYDLGDIYAVRDALEADAFFPAKAWAESFTVITTLAGAAAAWGMAYAVGNRRP